MKQIIAGLALLLFGSAIEAATIELTDGTVIRGAVVGLNAGRYKINSRSLGVLFVDEDKIASIDYGSKPSRTERSATPAASSSAAGADIRRLQIELAGNVGLMQSIGGLQTDPQIQAILSDPEIMQAVMNHDLEALQNNPKFVQLMSNPNIQRISKQALGQ